MRSGLAKHERDGLHDLTSQARVSAVSGSASLRCTVRALDLTGAETGLKGQPSDRHGNEIARLMSKLGDITTTPMTGRLAGSGHYALDRYPGSELPA